MTYWDCNDQVSCRMSCDFNRNEELWMQSANDLFCLEEGLDKQPLREKNRKNYHVPHKNKPPHVVAKRNARERKRVQAVNSAFVRLRRVVPIQNFRGKRVSKVKTLQHAINYIRALQNILSAYEGSYKSYQVNKYIPIS